MKLLDRFEQSMERLMEGSVGSIFRQKMQPAEIGRALEKAMFDHRQVSVGTTIVPNRYTVALNPRDYAQFAGYPQGLAHQMERFLFERATEKGATALDRIQVSIVENENAKRGRPTITCAISDMHRPAHSRPRPTAPSSRVQSALPPAQATQPFRPRRGWTPNYLLRAVEGVRRGDVVRLDRSDLTVGRADDNALVIGASEVSRHHARINLIDGVPRLEDIGSRNGTYLNGQPVRHADLAAGDRVAFGSQVFEVATDADGDAR
ncbi:MAG: DUF3662 and FHA domain-containing protein [Thermomicrobiales bacterium]